MNEEGPNHASADDARDAVRAAEERALEAEHALLRERDRMFGLLARLGQATWELQRERERADRAEALLGSVTGSLRYRVGMIAVSPGTAVKRLRGSRGA